MLRTDFTYKTNCKGQVFTNVATGYKQKINNKSVYCVFYKGDYIGVVETKKAAERFIENLIRHDKLTYTQEYR